MSDLRMLAGISAAILAVILALSAVLGLGCRAWTHNMDVSSCSAFAHESGRVTKFVDYNFWSWGCLTPQADGKWIDVHNLREVGIR